MVQEQTDTQELFQLVQRAKHEWETTADSLSQFICMLNKDLIIQRANRIVSAWELADVTEVPGMDFHNLFHPDCDGENCYLHECLSTAWETLEETGSVDCEAEDTILGRYLHIRMRPVYDKDSKTFDSAAVVVEDITVRKTLEREREELLQRVEEQSQLLRTILSNTPDQIYMYDADGLCMYGNVAAEWHLGLNEAEMIGKSWTELGFPEEDLTQFEHSRKQVMELRNRLRGEIEHRRGTEAGFYEYIISPVVTSERIASHVIVVLRDITERKIAAREIEDSRDTLELRVAERTQELSEANEHLQRLSHQLVQVQEQERRHIALELHDEIGQVLTGLKFTIQQALNADPDDVKEVLNLASGQIKDVTNQVREMSLNLRPSMLDDLGLLPALLWHFSRYTERTNIEVDFKHSGLKNARFSPDVEIAVYRVVQEALTNVARYAKTDEVTVRLTTVDELLRVDIQDYGTGFDVQPTIQNSKSTGLTGMRERVRVLGGEFVIRSNTGMGTHITLHLPTGD